MSREIDAIVAEKVMGWTKCDHTTPCHAENTGAYGMGCPPYDPARRWEIPPYSTSCVADYEVLKHVREKWDTLKLTAFCRALLGAWKGDYAIAFAYANYKPGDYSKAALAALGIEGKGQC